MTTTSDGLGVAVAAADGCVCSTPYSPADKRQPDIDRHIVDGASTMSVSDRPRSLDTCPEDQKHVASARTAVVPEITVRTRQPFRGGTDRPDLRNAADDPGQPRWADDSGTRSHRRAPPHPPTPTDQTRLRGA
jgi:hypothetical protein